MSAMSRPLLQLMRTVPTLPRSLAKPSPRTRNILILSLALSLLFYTLLYQQAFSLGDSEKLASARAKLQSIFPWTADRIEHPIAGLMAEAKMKYQNMMNRQSTTLASATEEYRRRYQRDPPKGFDDWFTFAMENNVKIIDEYDGLDKDLRPFREMSGIEFRKRVITATKLPNVYTLSLSQGRITTQHNDFNLYLKRFMSKLPDMSVTINEQDEPKILVPWEYGTENTISDMDLNALGKMEFTDAWNNNGTTWDAFRQTCDPSSPARRSSAAGLTLAGALVADHADDLLITGDPNLIGFRKRQEDDLDFCEHPSRRFLHGHFSNRWRTIPALLPLLSPGKPRGYGDLLIPSNYYVTNWPQYTYGDDHNGFPSDFDHNEKAWHQKLNMMYWRGSTTGGWNMFPTSFDRFHRQRFVQMTFRESPLNRTAIFPSSPSREEYAVRDIPASKLNLEIVNSGFSKALECEDVKPDGCKTVEKTFHFTDDEGFHAHWKYKYVVDIDGMSYSARFRAFLKSDSAPIKATIYREFFTEWIQPWLHYIPLSSDYDELYSIYGYFTGASSSMEDSLQSSKSSSWLSDSLITSPKGSPKDSDAQLRAIGQAGREWALTNGRLADLEAYVFRLLLEWARLWADDREVMSYKGY